MKILSDFQAHIVPRMDRSKETQAVSALRNECTGGPVSTQYLVADPDVLVTNYEGLLLQLLRIPGRKTQSFLEKAIAKAFPRLTNGERKTFAQRLQAGLNHVQLKKKQSTSGKKLCPAVQRLVREFGSLPDEVSPASSSAPSICLPVSSTPVLNAAQIAASARELLGEFDDVAPAADIQSAESAETIGSSQPDSQPEPEYKQYFDNASLCMVRLFPSGNIQKSNMLPGDNGFAVATFPGSEERISTEVPNSLLNVFQKSEPVKKRPAAIRIRSPGLKRPAAEPDVPAANSSEICCNFAIMYYKEPKHSWAIRQKDTGKQLFQVACKDNSKEAVHPIILEARQKLVEGKDWPEVKEWANSQRDNLYAFTH